MPMLVVRCGAMQDVERRLGLAPTDPGAPRGVLSLRVEDAWRLKAKSPRHSLRAHPNLPSAWHPRRRDLKLRRHQDAVVAPPSSALLRDAIFQDRHAGPEESADHRLNHAGPEVEALQSRGVVQCLHEFRRVEGLAFWFHMSHGRHRRLRQAEAQRLKPHVHVSAAFEQDRGGVVALRNQRQRVHPMRARHTESAPRVCGGRQTAWPCHHKHLRERALRRALKHMAVHRCGGFKLGPAPRRNPTQRPPQQHTPWLPKKERTQGLHG